MAEVIEKKTKKFDKGKIFGKVMAIFMILLMLSSAFFTCIYYLLTSVN